MKFTCEKENLSKAISLVGRLSTTRATLPILQNIYLETKDNSLLVKATDLEQTLQMSIPGSVEERGKITVPARLLTDYLQNNSDSSVTLATNDTTLHIYSTNHKATLLGLPAEEYPSVPDITVEQSVALPTKQVTDGITKTIFSVTNDDTRPVLTGLLWRFSDSLLELVGTDGYRLAHQKINYQGKLTGDYIIPKKALQELLRIMDGDEVEVMFAGTQVRFQVGSIQMTSRILEGKFPDYQAIMPKKKEITAVMSSISLLQSLKLASLFSRDSAFSTKIHLEKDYLEVQATSVQLGDTKNKVLLEKEVEGSFDISLNAQYLIDALTHMSGDVLLELNDSNSPVVVRPKSDELYLYLVMPLRHE